MSGGPSKNNFRKKATEFTPKEAIKHLAEGVTSLTLTGLAGSSKHFLLAELQKKVGRTFVYVAPDKATADTAAQNLSYFLNRPIPILEKKELFSKEQIISDSQKTTAQRINWLFYSRSSPILIAVAPALLERTIPKDAFEGGVLEIAVGEVFSWDSLIQKLLLMGYKRTDFIEQEGEFSPRGSILDIFSPGYELPLRLELLGDEVSSIRHFSLEDQRSRGRVEKTTLLPASEILLNDQSSALALGYVRKRAAEVGLTARKKLSLQDAINNQERFNNFEWLLPAYYSELGTAFDYVPADAVLVFDDWDRCRSSVERSSKLMDNISGTLSQSIGLSPPAEELFIGPGGFEAHRNRFQSIYLEDLDISRPESVKVAFKTEAIALEPSDPDLSKFDVLEKSIESWSRTGYDVFISANYSAERERLAQILEERDIEGVRFLSGFLSEGFVFPEARLAVVTEKEIFGEAKKHIQKTSRIDSAFLTSFGELKPGDYIVHREVGIGIFNGMKRFDFGGVEGDFIDCQFKGGDRIYVPVEKLKLIQRYIGANKKPQVDKLGHQSWKRVVRRVRKAVFTIAHDLIELYARRKAERGFQFSRGDHFFKEFELAFPYEETPDQEAAINDTIADMESPKPMDRLICGDVGFGKTEVAIRASFKAVMDGKQVAVLAPTTLLAYQHLTTFKKRFKDYPTDIRMLSRFTSSREQKRILDELPQGKVDIVIGTHKLLGAGVAFKDLGLLIVDEEQRFGVTHKEKLRKIKPGIGVLTLTATPIPRTLQISLAGIRDISVINTPPEGRQSIFTTVQTYHPEMIKDAIEEEMARDGTVFFIHNRIHDIFKYSDMIKELVPTARVEVAHGRMKETQIERALTGFMNGDIDVLVTTAIVESGLDIPRANTIIINHAQNFGLADLYQLRGRVGRTKIKAKALLLLPTAKSLTDEARKRLKAILELSELGSGFKLALSDLEIRGAGNIFGDAQSGHIADVGLEMYLEMLDEAIRALKDEAIEDGELERDFEPEIKSQIPSFLPDNYVADSSARLLFYKRLSSIKTDEGLAELKTELIDRFGPLPQSAENLLAMVELRFVMKKLFVQKVEINKKEAVILFLENSDCYKNFKPGGRLRLRHNGPSQIRVIIEKLEEIATTSLIKIQQNNQQNTKIKEK